MNRLSATDVAYGIEEGLRRKHGSSTGKHYKAAARSLVLNIKRNVDLRRRLLIDRDLEPASLAGMEWSQLSTAEQRSKDGKVQVCVCFVGFR